MNAFTFLNGINLAGISPGFLRYGSAALLTIALALPEAAFAATVAFRIDRTSTDPEERTFSGSGLLEFDGPTTDLADISLLTLEIATLGTAFFEETVATPVTHVFRYETSDITTVTDLVATGGGLGGSLIFESVDSENASSPAASSSTSTAGLASGFCFSASDIFAECIRGGGTSSGLDAILRVAPVPLPASLPLLALAFGGLGGLVLRQASRRR